MLEGEITPELQGFIARYIRSVEKLEVLLLLSAERERAWSSKEVYQKIQSSLFSVNERLAELCSDGFIKEEPGDHFQFRPETKELEERVANLNVAYQQRRIKVIESIFSKGADDLRKFSDAFKLRKEK
jgi:predicted transcriptional regulator